MNISDLPRDIIVYMALTMDIPEILSLCETSQKFNNIVCENKNFWISKLYKDYQIEYTDIKSVLSDPKTLYQLLISEPDELYYIIENSDKDDIKQKNHITGLAVENMFKIKRRNEYDNFPIGKQIYILYQTNYAYTEFSYYFTEYNIVTNTLTIMTKLMDDDVEYVLEDTTFEDFYGKPREEYINDLQNQLEQIKNKDTVVIKIPTLHMSGEKVDDTYVLHKFVKK